MSLDRFTSAQAASVSGYEAALAELESGQKTTHWIWYVFPQLAGLGHSWNAQRYALVDLDEAISYLEHPLLGPRLAQAVGAVARQVERDQSLTRLMGSRLDALKLVSSLTLFELALPHVRIPATPALTTLGAEVDRVLAAALGEGLPRCAFTLMHARRR